MDQKMGNGNALIRTSAVGLARMIAAGEVSSREVTRAFLDRIEQVDPALNAVTTLLDEDALDDAAEADRRQAAGQPLGALHGVPVTIKECFYVAGCDSTVGLNRFLDKPHEEDCLHVKRLRDAGAIVMAHTNVPQLMIFHETDNPIYGRTNNPWNLARGPGGSTGGEAALIAAGGSPLGLGGDLGGSIRLPCNWCGISGLKPTSGRLSRSGGVEGWRGMDAIQYQPGPMSRRVEDLFPALQALVGDPLQNREADVSCAPLRDPRDVDITSLKIGYWADDEYFASSPAVVRAVETAAQMLRDRGAVVEPFKPVEIPEIAELFFLITSADGGADVERVAGNSELDWRVKRLRTIASMGWIMRAFAVQLMKFTSQPRRAELLRTIRPYSANEYWQACYRIKQLRQRFSAAMQAGGFHAILNPAHALPALRHGRGADLFQAAANSFVANLLAMPCGVTPLTRVREDEQNARAHSHDLIETLARRTDEDSAGLPVGVQMMAPPWREDIVIATLQAIEDAAITQDDYPTWPGDSFTAPPGAASSQ